MSGGHFRGGSQRRNCFPIAPLLDERQPKAKVQLIPVRFELHCFLELIRCLIEAARVIERPSHFFDRYERKRVERLGLAVRPYRFLVMAGVPQVHAALPVDVRVAGRELDGATRFGVRRSPIPIVEQAEQAENRVAFGKSVI